MYVLYAAIDTLRQLELVESERRSVAAPRRCTSGTGSATRECSRGPWFGSWLFCAKALTIVGPAGQVLAVTFASYLYRFLYGSELS